MHQIAIISASVRKGRKSHCVALFLERYINRSNKAKAYILDLKEYQFPIFEERLKYMDSPSEKTIDFAEKIRGAAGVIIVTPEYNGGYPASLKNAIDLLVEEWKHKPISLATVSNGAFAGTQVGASLPFILSKIGAVIVPTPLRVPTVQDTFAEDGTPANQEMMNKRVDAFLNDLYWHIDMVNRNETN